MEAGILIDYPAAFPGCGGTGLTPYQVRGNCFLFGTKFATDIDDMLNTKVLDWIEGYILTRVLIFGDFIGTVKRADFLLDIDTNSDYFRRYEGMRIQALTLPVKSRNLSTLLGEIEACFQRGWQLLDSGQWTEADFDQVFKLSQRISSEITTIRGAELMDLDE
jgi:hypothetical protein